MTKMLHHADIMLNDTKAHLARATLTSVRPSALHSHDFYELFWVQNGLVRHHTQTGVEVLKEGAMVLVSPDDSHALQGKGDHAMVVSCSFHPQIIADLNARHPNLWPAKVLIKQRNIKEMAQINQMALAFETSPRSALSAEAFLLPLLNALHLRSAPLAAPDWFLDAVHASKDRAVFSKGAAGFVAQTGRAHAHVSRTMKRIMGQTPSEYINALRMEHAARALTSDSEPIGDIAADCGFSNMAHFHQLFRAHHALTPLQYRQRFQRDVIQPH